MRSLSSKVHCFRFGWLIVVSSLAAAHLIAVSPVFAAPTMIFNSYGWSSVYALGANSATGATTHLPPADLLQTTFVSQTDGGPDGRVWGTAGSELWAINVSGPAAVWQQVSKLQHFAGSGLAWTPQAELYMANLQEVHQVNPATGATIAGTGLSVSRPGGSLLLPSIAFGSDGTLYGADTSALYKIDRTTGLGTAIYTRPVADNHGIFLEIDFGSDGILRAMSYYDYVLAYNPATGIGDWSPWKLSYNSQAFAPSAMASVPEPGSLAMAMLGGALLLSCRLLRRRN